MFVTRATYEAERMWGEVRKAQMERLQEDIARLRAELTDTHQRAEAWEARYHELAARLTDKLLTPPKATPPEPTADQRALDAAEDELVDRLALDFQREGMSAEAARQAAQAVRDDLGPNPTRRRGA